MKILRSAKSTQRNIRRRRNINAAKIELPSVLRLPTGFVHATFFSIR